MSYTFISGDGSILTADSSIISGVIQRPIVNVGSILSAIPTTFSGSPSISGAVTVVGNPSISGQVGASVIGLVPVNISNTNLNVGGSVVAFISGIPQASVHGAVSVAGGSLSVANFPTNQNISGSVMSFEGAGWSGSVAAFVQGAVPVNATLVAPSIVGTYAEDAAHISGEKGLFVLGVRNDTLSSVAGADGDYLPLTTGPTGAITAHDAPINKWIQGTADLRVVLGASVTAIASQGASVFTYIREVQVVNMGSASVLVTFAGGLGSILGYTIAPAGGGSNFVTRYKTGENSAFTASISGTASVLVSAQGFTAKI